MIARILEASNVSTGAINTMYEHRKIQELTFHYIRKHSESFPFPSFSQVNQDWKEKVLTSFNGEAIERQWMIKGAWLTQMWQTWNEAFPDARWIIVRRRSADIVNSCVKTAYMTLFKQESNRKLIETKTEEEAWLWWIHKYEEAWVSMITQGVNCKTVWPERMVTGDYLQIHETLEWLGLEWNPEIPNIMEPLLKKSRRN
ncbi:MAG: hypothetical protein KKC20_24680 [Proteobacteria bacterium]|nr:hypothetical protein [Pseudomonadota bacterium]